MDYDITNPNLNPFSIQIFRSDKGTYSSSDSHNVAVGYAFSISGDNLKQDHHEVTINLTSLPDNEPANPFQPLAPDPALPYVLAVAVDANNKALTNVAVDESHAHFKIYIIGAVSVGFDPSNKNDNSPPSQWVSEMAAALGPIGPGEVGYNVVIPFGWASGSPDSQAIYRAGKKLYDDISQAAQAITEYSDFAPNDVIDVHLIGHSRGSVVVDLAMNELIVNPPDDQLAHGYYELTLLDPHPANKLTVVDADINSISPLLSFIAWYKYYTFSNTVNDPAITVPARVNQAVVYYQMNSILGLSTASLLQNPSEFAINLLGVPAEVTIDDPISTVTNSH